MDLIRSPPSSPFSQTSSNSYTSIEEGGCDDFALPGDNTFSFDGEDSEDQCEALELFPSVDRIALGNVDINTERRHTANSHIGHGKENRTGVRKHGNRALDVQALIEIDCCMDDCVKKLTLQEIRKHRANFLGMSMQEQRQWVLQFFIDHSSNNKTTFIIGTKIVCMKSWYLCLGLTRSRFYNIRRDFQDRKVMYLDRNWHKKNTTSVAVEHCKTWFHDFIKKHGDMMPTSEQVHLPSSLRKQEVYHMMKQDMETDGLVACCMTSFFNVWEKDFKYVVIPKENRFAKCDACTLFKTELEKTRDKVKKRSIQELRNQHLRKQSVERRKYYKHIRKSLDQPEKYLSLILDGMDQSKTDLPSFVRTSKKTSAMWRLQTHLTGAIVHGKAVYGFFDCGQFPHDPNLTMNILLQILVFQRQNQQILYLQMDNCAKDNKNRFVLALCCLLVQLDIFKKIKVGFLMVGHTHEDIDQLFSRVASYLKVHRAVTIPSLLDAFGCSYSALPANPYEVTHLFDVKSWLSPHMQELFNHSQPHCFRIKKNDSGVVTIHTKKWSSDEAWSAPSHVNGVIPVLLKSIPDGVPEMVEANYDSLDVDQLSSSISSVGCFMSGDEREWWKRFISSIRVKETTSSAPNWFLFDLMSQLTLMQDSMHPTCSVDPTSEGDGDEEDEDDLCLSALKRIVSTHETPIPPIHVGRKPTAKEKRIEASKDYSIGKMVACHMTKYEPEWPQIGKVKSHHADTGIEVEWYTGTYTAIFRPVYLKGKKIWTEIIQVEDILFSFNLTNGKKLPREVVDRLKECRQVSASGM